MTILSKTPYYFLLFFLFFGACHAPNPPIKVGILHSLSGTMAISEVEVKNATLMAIQEINAQGGILGRQLEPVIVDGASDWGRFAFLADSLIVKAQVAVVFGCWTSASRKSVKPVFEKHKHLLFYPVQYEGLETSPHIVYTGAAPNQQIIPALRWGTENIGKKVFLVGSDYVFPRTANALIKEVAKRLEVEIVGEEYIKLGEKKVEPMVQKIKKSGANFILNTINGDSNIAFFEVLRQAGITAEQMPTISFSIAEPELQAMNPEMVAGDYAAWNYFQSLQNPENKQFVESYKKNFGKEKVCADPMEAAYLGVYLWKQAVERAKTPEVGEVRKNLGDLSFQAPEGLVYIDKATQHTWKTVRIGRIRPDGQFEIVWDSEKPVRPIPYPAYRKMENWHSFLDSLQKNWNGNWAKLD